MTVYEAMLTAARLLGVPYATLYLIVLLTTFFVAFLGGCYIGRGNGQALGFAAFRRRAIARINDPEGLVFWLKGQSHLGHTPMHKVDVDSVLDNLMVDRTHLVDRMLCRWFGKNDRVNTKNWIIYRSKFDSGKFMVPVQEDRSHE